MSRQVKKIVFLGHEGYRTGASILLLQMIQWIAVNRQIKVYLILLDGGPLVNEYEKYAKVYVKPKSTRLETYWVHFKVRLLIYTIHPDLIYCNTVATLKFLKRYRSVFSKVGKVLHIHEMPHSILELVGGQFDIDGFDRVLVVNRRIEKFVSGFYPFPSRIFLTPEYIDVEKLAAGKALARAPGMKIVLGVGVASWRKGFDLFLQTAAICRRDYPSRFKFLWVGPISTMDRNRAIYEAGLLDLGDSFSMIGEVEHVGSYFRQADLFFLSSREDPFPMVMLEAAVYGVPVLYFAGSGGAEDFFDHREFEVPYGDCASAAKKIEKVLGGEISYFEFLVSARERALECDQNLIIPKILEEIGIGS